MKKSLLAMVAVAVIGVATAATLTQTKASTELSSESMTSVSAASGQDSTLTFDVSASGALAEGDTIYVDVPDALSATSVSASMDDFSDAAMTLTNGVLSYDLGVGESVVASGTVSISVLMDLSASDSGVYGFAIYTKDSDGAVIDEGSALLAVDNDITVTAEVLEAIIMQLDKNAIHLAADPSVDGGEASDSSTFNISSNAGGGFDVRQEIDGPLSGSAHGETIANYDGILTDNYFGYSSDGSAASDGFATGTAATTGITDLTATDAGTQVDVGGRNVGTFQDTINYHLNVDFGTPADDYTGTVTYTIVPSF